MQTPGTVNISAAVEISFQKRLQRAAREEYRSISSVIRVALVEYLAKHHPNMLAEQLQKNA
jgi:hypothetical protein